MARIKRRTIANRNITKLRVNIMASEVKINRADEMMSIPDHVIQTEVVKKDASTQTYDYDFSSRINIILKYFSFGSVANLFSILTDSLNDWKSIHLIILSVKCLDERGRYRDEENSKQLRLEHLRELLMEHPAFNNGNTHLQRLASEHGFNLWNRFWRALEMYQSGASYQNVLEKLFGAKSSSKISLNASQNHPT
ncbi:hypothetical protein BpHYR1_019625 [Brachionus plicatilis]|uniref:Uncharacterized protein n=1 Tax=Brachionus plicatilis TaxID=10195 RepID=A0A3M7QFG8_BRAPC|nr:hypothetical protein BpHYR1_019625 [Brachionus plicatilis]